MTTFPQRRTIGVLSAAQVVGGIGNGAGLSIGALLIRDVSGSSAWAGMAVVAVTLGAALFTLPLSSLATRRGRRPALTTGWWIGAIGATLTVAGAVWEALPLILAGFALYGASTAANLQSRFAAADRAPTGDLGRSISIVVWSTTVGAVIGPNLTEPGAALARVLGLPALSGPMLFSMVSFAIAGAIIWLLLRPDPLEPTTAADAATHSIRAALPHLRGASLTAVTATALSHAVMVAVMALTPVHMQDHGAALSIIGLTISLHIAGMYALSPLMGWATDRFGPRPTIVAGQVMLILATALAGTSGHSETRIAAGLILLGVGWSASVIAGATMLSESAEPTARPLLQGFSDLAMNLAGALGGLVAGLVVAIANFGVLNASAALLTVPVLVAVLTARRPKSAIVGT